MQYTAKHDCVVSADEGGFIEYWQPSEPWGLPSVRGLWKYKSDTDLFEFKKVGPRDGNELTRTDQDDPNERDVLTGRVPICNSGSAITSRPCFQLPEWEADTNVR